MQLGMVGLGRMGANMALRLMKGGHRCVVHDRAAARAEPLVAAGAEAAGSLAELVEKLAPPRAAWIMLPSGPPTEETVAALGGLMSPGDVVVDGGNTHFKDDVRRAEALAAKGVDYVDAGTSGGVWGAERGYCLMLGGEKETVSRLAPIFRTLAPGRGDIPRTPGRERAGGTAEEGFLYCGPAGAGHFVKMVHNGIEYGLMQAYAEGFDIMRGSGYELPLADVAEVWRRGSVVSSWLLDLTAMALLEQPSLEKYTGAVQDSGEGRWTIQAAIEEAVPAEVLSASLFARFRSRRDHTFAEKLLSAMREKFGGHVERASGG